jgi:hypothetical protein
MLTQLAEWTRLGFITRTSAGTYAADTPPQPSTSYKITNSAASAPSGLSR